MLLEEVLQAVTDSWLLALGAFIILAVLLLPNGLAALAAVPGLTRPAKDPDDA